MELSSPLRIDSTGGFAVVTSPGDIVREHVRSVVGTQKGERVMRYDYGVDSLETLFQSNSPVELEDLEDRISEALQTHAPEITLLSVTATSDIPGGKVDVAVRYNLANGAEQTTVVSTAATNPA